METESHASDESSNAVEATLDIAGTPCKLVEIRTTGDCILDVSFENSRYATVSASKEEPRSSRPRKYARPTKSRVCFRVRLETLKRSSKYFEHLLGSDNFKEGNIIAAQFASLKLQDLRPSESDAGDLPRIEIVDDDEASQTMGREVVFEDLLRILHDMEALTRPTVVYIASLAIMADRFECTPMIARYVKALKTLKWPVTYGKSHKDGGTMMSPATEELLRQKILIAWILDQPIRLAQCTKELILRGSTQWVVRDEDVDTSRKALWWHLPDSLEDELLHRREVILNTIASVQNHFLRQYSSRERQCKLGYDSSPACDSYQLGEMVKFLTHKNLLHFVSFSYTDFPPLYNGDIEQLINTLRQCPSYQIDKNHAHCGLRTRLLPALEYIQSMTSGSIGLNRQGWKVNRDEQSWARGGGGNPFRFTREINDPRLRVEGSMVIDRYARALFTASEWDWSPEEPKAESALPGMKNFKLP